VSVVVTLTLNGAPVPVELDEAALAAIAAALPAPDAERWPEFMSSVTASCYLDISPERLAKAKQRGTGPRFCQEGPRCRVQYRRSDLDAWLIEHRRGGDAQR
jgi:hypothetical protein